MDSIWSGAFWKATAERAIKTLAQTAGAGIAVGAGFGDINWVLLGSVAGVAAVVSVLTSVGSNALTRSGPSLTSAEEVTK